MKCRPNTTKQKLIDTAWELLWTSSYGAVSVDDICKAAGVKKGSFYHFFPSKVDLAIASMEETFATIKPEYDSIFSPGNPPLQRFSDLADHLIAGQEEAAKRYGRVCGCPCISLGSEIAGQESGVRAAFDLILSRKARYYENAIRDLIADGLVPADTDAKAKAEELSTFMVGQLTVARIQNDLASLKRNLKPGLLQVLGISQEAKRVA
ncbi:MAG: TetR/AcrR family transcriptional regulator [Rhodospirillaceae bacterium]